MKVVYPPKTFNRNLKNILDPAIDSKRSKMSGLPEKIWDLQRWISVLKAPYNDLWDMFGKYYVTDELEKELLPNRKQFPYMSDIFCTGIAGFGVYKIELTFYKARPEWITECVLGPIHREYNVVWDMNPNGNEMIYWTSTPYCPHPKWRAIRFEVNCF